MCVEFVWEREDTESGVEDLRLTAWGFREAVATAEDAFI